MRTRSILALLAVATLMLSLQPVRAPAQEVPERPEMTLEDIFASGVFRPERFQGGKWTDEGPIITYVEQSASDSTTDLIEYNLESSSRSVLVDGSNLQAEDVGRTILIEDYAFGPDRRKVLIYTDSKEVWRYNTKGFYYVYDRDTQELTPVSARDRGYQMFAKFGPEARRVAFVRERDLFVVDVKSGEERRLTASGSEGGIINGTSDWVYEEEFGLRDGWRWSPDGRHIAFVQLDESDTRTYTLQDLREGQYPDLTRYRYPKAGHENSEIHVGVVEVGSAETRFFDTGTWQAGGDSLEYIPRLGWTPPIDGRSRVWIMRMNRAQNHVDLLYGDPSSGQVRQAFEETSETWIEVETGFTGLDVGKITFLDDREQFVWVSEADGHRHLYLHENTGERVRQLTHGHWDVTDFHGVDPETESLYFTATIESPLERQLYRTTLEGGGSGRAAGSDPGATSSSGAISGPSPGTTEGAVPDGIERVSDERGWHSVNLSRDARYYIDTHSDSETPPVVTLHRNSGTVIDTLVANERLKETLARYDLPTPEFYQLRAADDTTSLNGYLMKPNDFDPDKQYPLLMYVYGGPGAQTVTRRWGGSRFLWHAYLAREHDVLVASVDNRGTGGRGKAFKSVTYQKLGQIEARDQQAVARALKERSYVDSSRVGIWGWSYGGYMSLMASLAYEGPRVFDVALSVAPVTHWKLYDTIYTERYMSTPQANPDGYREGAATTYADRLREDQDLLLVHGGMDDNVHLQNSVQMIDALQDAQKQFDFMMYPGYDHSIAGDGRHLHVYRKLTNFLIEHIQ